MSDNEGLGGEENKNDNDEGFIEKGVSSVNYVLTGSSVQVKENGKTSYSGQRRNSAGSPKGQHVSSCVFVELMVPFKSNFMGTPMMDSMEEIKLSKLTFPSQMRAADLDISYIDLQLLRIISPGPSTNTAYHYSRASIKGLQVNYTRMFLFHDSSLKREGDNNLLFYAMESKSSNICLFGKTMQFCNNGTITIGTICHMLRPQPVSNFINDIPLVETFEPLVALKYPMLFPTIQIDNQISRDEALVFINTAVSVSVLSMTIFQSSCAGLLCDNQRVHD
eukprot:3403805-Ditylum_brightwellii.AAC.1